MEITTGKVYVQYACGHITLSPCACRLQDPSRKYKNGQNVKVSVCPECQTLAAQCDYFFKICPVCGELKTSKKGGLKPGRCAECGKQVLKNKLKKRKSSKCVQAGKPIDMPETIKTEPLCTHRTQCLPWSLDKVLHCGGCPHFEPEKIERSTTAHDYDPCFEGSCSPGLFYG